MRRPLERGLQRLGAQDGTARRRQMVFVQLGQQFTGIRSPQPRTRQIDGRRDERRPPGMPDGGAGLAPVTEEDRTRGQVLGDPVGPVMGDGVGDAGVVAGAGPLQLGQGMTAAVTVTRRVELRVLLAPHRRDHRHPEGDEFVEDVGFEAVGTEVPFQVVEPDQARDADALDRVGRPSQVGRAAGRDDHLVVGQYVPYGLERRPRLARRRVAEDQHESAALRCRADPVAQFVVHVAAYVGRQFGAVLAGAGPVGAGGQGVPGADEGPTVGGLKVAGQESGSVRGRGDGQVLDRVGLHDLVLPATGDAVLPHASLR
ncbi:hypothetical protein [Streptomyces tailanensis]|uniref:hypothetical protein n=1 Tax=Streptomyces tailanensis TaxID=2569858 RepID=UPI00122DE762|nr:hypothetical protein [Streptomyces tailanensis]